jgi:hypothetical protein
LQPDKIMDEHRDFHHDFNHGQHDLRPPSSQREIPVTVLLIAQADARRAAAPPL